MGQKISPGGVSAKAKFAAWMQTLKENVWTAIEIVSKINIMSTSFSFLILLTSKPVHARFWNPSHTSSDSQSNTNLLFLQYQHQFFFLHS